MWALNWAHTIWRSARHSLSQTPSYSTYNITSYNLEARSDIWKNDTYPGPVNKNGYSRGLEIFRTMEAAKKQADGYEKKLERTPKMQ